MAKRMAKQMELFEPVERGFNEGGDTSSAKDVAMQDLQSSAADKKAARQDQFDKLTDMLMSGEIKDMPEEQQQKFIKLYKMMKSQGFNEGGLMEEGGMVDEESGNEVPPGSLREEVRDDIPAQLSEGEFVFPADVVRYIGLENLMRMRQEAKQGLAQMEAMGQMGNSEEATVQDDLPFNMYDLDVEDDDERNYQVGGYVPPSVPQQPYNQPTQVNPQTGTYTLPGTGIAGYQVPSGTPTGYVPYGGATPYFQPVQFTGAQYQTALQTTNLPTFAETVGSKPGQYDELRTYQNDAGQTLQIPFKDGRPIYPIPEGYRPIGDQPAPEEEQTTVTPTLGQTTVRDDGGRDDGGSGPDSSPFGGNVNTLESSAYARAVANLGKSQLTSLAPTAALMSTLTGQPTANAIATATNTARNTAVDTLGLSNVSEATVSQLDAIGSAMNVVSNFTSIGQTAPTKSAAATVAKSITEAINTNQMSVEQANALSEMTMDDKTGALVGKDGKTGKDMSQADIDAITAYAEAMATDDDEDDAADDAAAAAAAAATPSSPSDYGAMSPEDFADAIGDTSSSSSKGDTPGSPGDPAGQTGVGGGPGGAPDGTGSGAAGDGQPLCLTENMKVKLNGVVDYVTNVNIGDIVGDSLVVEVMHKHMRNGYYVVNGELEITNDHPVLANGSWKRTEDLVLGDYINDVEVTSLEYVDQVTPTVYIGTADDRYDVYTEGEVYTVHGQYKNITKQAA
jgi:hypothetical protein